jgi:hydrogenase/urease accessory protein HupE
MTKCLRAVILAALAWSWSALAHPLEPALLQIRESAEGTFDVLWRPPPSQPGDAVVSPVLPDGCAEVSDPRPAPGGAPGTVGWRIRCSAGSLVGQRIGVDGLRQRKTDALLRVQLADGRLVQTVLRGDAPFATIPERAGPLDVLLAYLRLGFEHILTGPDHLLFVLGLVLLVRARRLLLWTITAFTAGHSVTLSLAALGFVNIPPKPVEVLIALTIFVVAVELTREAPGPASAMRRFPWAVAFAFGLLHGLGFAGALAQVGLPATDIPLALFSFNVGIELGQLVFVGLVLATRAALRRLPVRSLEAVARVPAYAIGSLAVFWILERQAAIL